MGRGYLQRMFTDPVQDLQEHHGSRTLCDRLARTRKDDGVLGQAEIRLIQTIESVFIGTTSKSGWPYVQHRGGPPGFLKVIDNSLIAFPVFHGNQQYLTSGNLRDDCRISLIMLDYATGRRLKLIGYAEDIDAAMAPRWVEKVRPDAYPSSITRVTLIHVVASDWNCAGHIPHLYPARDVDQTIEKLRAEIDSLKAQLASHVSRSSGSPPTFEAGLA
jgi:uncharacterized protein